MDLATLIGLLIGMGGLIGGFLLEGGHIGMLVVETAFIIVIGGTIGATMICFTMEELKKIGYFFKEVFVDTKVDYVTVVDTLVDTADKQTKDCSVWRASCLKLIMSFLPGLQLVIDGTDELTRHMLEMEIEALKIPKW